ncbi:hypothetical protein [Bacillus subtilis]|uniref:hypothetical protein n=1 Tax=Bacillus subtilis TaxID=1423 RepID=UPI0027229229|nr:hypothetical protein [Bacillus subtilis]MDP0484569.1 hypothetical protein [Bacillus subtilis]
MRKFYKSKYVIQYLNSIKIDGKKVKKVYNENFSTREKYKEQVISSLGEKEIKTSINILVDEISINKDTNLWHTSYFVLNGVIITLYFNVFNNFLPKTAGNIALVGVMFLIILMYISWMLMSFKNKNDVTQYYGYKRILEECLKKIDEEMKLDERKNGE